MTKAEWIRRCAARYLMLTGVETTPSPQVFAAGWADEQAEKFGASAAAWQSPEAVAEREADEDMDGEVP